MMPLHQFLCHDASSIFIVATIPLLLSSFSISFSRILKGLHLCNQDKSLFTWHILLNICYPIMLTSRLFIMHHQHHFPAGLYHLIHFLKILHILFLSFLLPSFIDFTCEFRSLQFFLCFILSCRFYVSLFL